MRKRMGVSRLELVFLSFWRFIGAKLPHYILKSKHQYLPFLKLSCFEVMSVGQQH